MISVSMDEREKIALVGVCLFVALGVIGSAFIAVRETETINKLGPDCVARGGVIAMVQMPGEFLRTWKCVKPLD